MKLEFNTGASNGSSVSSFSQCLVPKMDCIINQPHEARI
jgi:hypothetical protein